MEERKYHYYTKTMTLPDGTRKYFYGKTEQEVKLKMAEFSYQVLNTPLTESTVAKYIDYWFKVNQYGKVSDLTISNNRAMFDNHVIPVIGFMQVSEVKAIHIREIFSKSNYLCHATQTCLLGLLRRLFNMAVDDELIVKSPVPITMKVGGADREDVTALSNEEVKQLLEVSKGTIMETFVYVGVYSGMRSGEIRGLMWNDIDFDAHCIHVNHHVVPEPGTSKVLLKDGAKTKAGVRMVPMPECLESYLLNKKATAKSLYVVPNTHGAIISSSTLWNDYSRIVQSKLEFDAHPHRLRHTFTTLCYEGGLDLKELQFIMGHSSGAGNSSVTMTVYTHYRAKRFPETVAKVREIFSVPFELSENDQLVQNCV